MSVIMTDLLFVALGILIGMAIAAPLESHDDVDELLEKRRRTW